MWRLAKLGRAARLARLATALAAMGLVFMGAIVVPVYLVPALTAVLAAEARATSRSGTPHQTTNHLEVRT